MTALRTTYRRADGDKIDDDGNWIETTSDIRTATPDLGEPACDVIEEQWQLVRFRTVRLGTPEKCDVCWKSPIVATLKEVDGKQAIISVGCPTCHGSGVRPRVDPPWTEAEVWRNIKTGQPLGFTPPPNHTSPKLPEKLNTEIDYGDDNLSGKPPWYLYRPPLNGFERARVDEIRKNARDKRIVTPTAKLSCEHCEQWKAIATFQNRVIKDTAEYVYPASDDVVTALSTYESAVAQEGK